MLVEVGKKWSRFFEFELLGIIFVYSPAHVSVVYFTVFFMTIKHVFNIINLFQENVSFLYPL